MSKASEELVESAVRLARAIAKAARRELPNMGKAAGKIVRDDLPGIERSFEKALQDLRKDISKKRR